MSVRSRLSALGAAAVFGFGTHPAAAQSVTIKTDLKSGNTWAALKAQSGQALRGSMTINCTDNNVSFYKAGDPFATQVEGNNAKRVPLDGNMSTPIEKPADLDTAALCTGGKVNVPEATRVLRTRLQADGPG